MIGPLEIGAGLLLLNALGGKGSSSKPSDGGGAPRPSDGQGGGGVDPAKVLNTAAGVITAVAPVVGAVVGAFGGGTGTVTAGGVVGGGVGGGGSTVGGGSGVAGAEATLAGVGGALTAAEATTGLWCFIFFAQFIAYELIRRWQQEGKAFVDDVDALDVYPERNMHVYERGVFDRLALEGMSWVEVPDERLNRIYTANKVIGYGMRGVASLSTRRTSAQGLEGFGATSYVSSTSKASKAAAVDPRLTDATWQDIQLLVRLMSFEYATKLGNLGASMRRMWMHERNVGDGYTYSNRDALWNFELVGGSPPSMTYVQAYQRFHVLGSLLPLLMGSRLCAILKAMKITEGDTQIYFPWSAVGYAESLYNCMGLTEADDGVVVHTPDPHASTYFHFKASHWGRTGLVYVVGAKEGNLAGSMYGPLYPTKNPHGTYGYRELPSDAGSL